MIDSFGRKIEYMRISVTDRCNLRCRYCMPNGIEKIPMSKLLTYEEILKTAEAGTELGINRFKVTGGEPLVRRGVVSLIKGLKDIPGTEQVTMTTNGELLGEYLEGLLDAGLDAVNVSLDSIDPERYREITGGGDIDKVLKSIEAASETDLKVKLNSVLHKDTGRKDIIDIVSYSLNHSLDLRFIEMMPIGFGVFWQGMDITQAKNIIEDEFGTLKPTEDKLGNGPAKYYSIGNNDRIRIGFIGALSGMFCENCNRVRLSSQGMLRPCLCYPEGTDLKPYLKGDRDGLKEAIRSTVLGKPERHCFSEKATPDNMISIGG